MGKRNIGLDLIRASAIVLVLIDHLFYFFPQFDIVNPSQILGFYGVELFFVLSGFLIGKIAFKSFTQNFSGTSVRQFYARRWIRTLPLYYVVLIAFMILTNVIYKTNIIHFLHFFFLQNFIENERFFLSISWSLAIEEWFYLLLPLFLYFVFRGSSSVKKSFLQIVSAILIIVALRALYVLYNNPGFEVVRVFIPLRFDSLLLGVLLAFIKINYLAVYTYLQKSKVFFLSLFLLLATGAYYMFLFLQPPLIDSFFFKTFGFTIVSLFIALLIPFIENNITLYKILTKNKVVMHSITATSILSYSIYLLHLEIFTFLRVVLGKHVNEYILMAVGIATVFIASAATYSFIEKPFLAFRDKYFKSSYSNS